MNFFSSPRSLLLSRTHAEHGRQNNTSRVHALSSSLVPTLCVGMPAGALCVLSLPSLVPTLCVGMPAERSTFSRAHALFSSLGAHAEHGRQNKISYTHVLSYSLVPTLCVGMPPSTLCFQPHSIDPAFPELPPSPHFASLTIPSLRAIIPLSRHSLLHSNTTIAQGSPHIRS
jgi:hypothetical protein